MTGGVFDGAEGGKGTDGEEVGTSGAAEDGEGCEGVFWGGRGFWVKKELIGLERVVFNFFW
jgi:hypothetical protein